MLDLSQRGAHNNPIMIDNPKIFITYVIAVVLVVAAIFTGVKLWGGDSPQGETQNATSTASNKTTTNTSKGTGSKPGAPAAYDALVTYGSQGFSPNKITIKSGDVVRFINKSGETMRIWPAEDKLPGVGYAGLKQETSLGRNGTFDVHFSQKGIFLYENLNNKSRTGIVVVE